MSKKVELGDEVRCILTGFRGVASAEVIPLHGVRRFAVQPPVVGPDMKLPDAMDFDVTQLEVVTKTKVKATPAVEHDFNLGDEAIDPLTKIKGTVTGLIHYLNGCVSLALTRVHTPGKEDQERHYVQVQRAKLIKTAVKPKPKRERPLPSGGPITKSVRAF